MKTPQSLPAARSPANQAAEAGLGAASAAGLYGEQLDGSARQAAQRRQFAALFGPGSARPQAGPARVLQARPIKPFWFAGSDELRALLVGHASTETLERADLEKAWKLAAQIPTKQAVATHLGAALQQGEYKSGADTGRTTPKSGEPTAKQVAPVNPVPVTTPSSKDIEPASSVAKDTPQPPKLPSAKEPVPSSPTAVPRGPAPLANDKADAVPAKGGSLATGPGLAKVLADAYRDKGGKLTADDIVAAVKTHIGTGNAEAVLNDPALAWQLMEVVGIESGRRLHEQITKVTKSASPMRLKVAAVYPLRWTLRHYTKSRNKAGEIVPPGYTDLKSTLELTLRAIKKSENTSDADWSQIGNVGFSFYLLCIGDEAPKRSFLSDTTHYAEFEITTIPELFVSGDMLGSTGKQHEAKKPKGLRGSGSLVKQALCTLEGVNPSSPSAFLASLDSLFGNFEVKVPGQLQVQEWKLK